MKKTKFKVYKQINPTTAPLWTEVSADDFVIDNEGDLYEDGGYDGLTLVNKKKYKYVFFTGLKDKNGKEIYEGDVVKYDEVSGGDYDKDNLIGVIKFGEAEFYISHDSDDACEDYGSDLSMPASNKCVEVIGNIYEQPELLTPSS